MSLFLFHLQVSARAWGRPNQERVQLSSGARRPYERKWRQVPLVGVLTPKPDALCHQQGWLVTGEWMMRELPVI